MVFCQKCGTRNGNTAKFCNKCGSSLKLDSSARTSHNLKERNEKQVKNNLWYVAGGLILTPIIIALAYWGYVTYFGWYTPSCYYTTTCTANPICPSGFAFNSTNACAPDIVAIAGILTGTTHLNLSQANINLLQSCSQAVVSGGNLAQGCKPRAVCPTGYNEVFSSSAMTCILNNICGSSSSGYYQNYPPRCHS